PPRRPRARASSPAARQPPRPLGARRRRRRGGGDRRRARARRRTRRARHVSTSETDAIDLQPLRAALRAVRDPATEREITAGQLTDLRVEGGRVIVAVDLISPGFPLAGAL